jgi:hypothetical protein
VVRFPAATAGLPVPTGERRERAAAHIFGWRVAVPVRTPVAIHLESELNHEVGVVRNVTLKECDALLSREQEPAIAPNITHVLVRHVEDRAARDETSPVSVLAVTWGHAIVRLVGCASGIDRALPGAVRRTVARRADEGVDWAFPRTIGSVLRMNQLGEKEIQHEWRLLAEVLGWSAVLN